MTAARLLILFLLALPGIAMAGPPDKVGMVVDVQGASRLVVDGASKKLDLLAYVSPGARIEVDAGAVVSVSLYATRSVHQIKGPAVVQVAAEGLESVSGTAPEARLLAQQLIASAQPRDRVHGAVRMRDAATGLALVTPENGTVLLRAPANFHWEATVPGPYSLTLSEAAAPGEPLLTTQAQQTTWMASGEVVLEPGKSYQWTVSAPGAAAATAVFSLAPADVTALLAGIRPAADAPVGDWVLYATALQEHGVRDEARDAWKAIARMRPDLAKARILAR